MKDVPGIAQAVATLSFTFIQFFSNSGWKAQVIEDIEYANIADTEFGWEMVGFHMGEIVHQFFDFTNPSYDFHTGIEWWKYDWDNYSPGFTLMEDRMYTN